MPCSRWAWLALCACLVACSQVVDFDRDVLSRRGAEPGETTDASTVLVPEVDPSTRDASSGIGGGGTGQWDGTLPGPVDPGFGLPDGGEPVAPWEGGISSCDPTTHAGCASDELCCDGVCVPATANAGCEACGRACGGESSGCFNRRCMCGDTPACFGPTPICVADGEGAGAHCVECLGPTDCAGRADGRTQCVGNACVACDPARGNAGCANPTPICDPASRSCVGCNADLRCDDGLTCTSGRCLGCNDQTNAGCDPAGTTPVCEPAGGGQFECVGCSSDADCSGNANGSQCVLGACRGCDPVDNAGCSGDRNVCDPASFSCRGCFAATDCRGGGYCAIDVWNFLAGGRCVECLLPNHCSSGLTCDSASKTCRDCAGVGNNDRAHNEACALLTGGWRPVCDVESRSCVRCTSHRHCGWDAPICDRATKQCVRCTQDAECAAREARAPICTPLGGCVQCTADDTRACYGAAPNCDASRGTCVGCSDDASCGGNTPLCRNERCQDCREAGDWRDVAKADTACERKNADRPWCIWAGPHQGECGGCAPGRPTCERGGDCDEVTLDCALPCDPATHDRCNPTGTPPTFCVEVGERLECRECGPDAPCGNGRSCDNFTCSGRAAALAPLSSGSTVQ